MRHLFIFLFVLTELICKGQAVIGMSSVFSFTPSTASTVFSTVNFGDTVNLKVYVKNSGNTAYSGVISVKAFRDTTAGVICDTVAINQLIQPNDSVAVILTFMPIQGPNAFKTAGNGNTIVVWPVYYNGTLLDGINVKPILYIMEPNSVLEFETNPFKIFPNPALNNITIKAVQNNEYKKIMIYDVFARKVKDVLFKEQIDVSDLTPGSYWMIISSESKSYRVSFIKE